MQSYKRPPGNGVHAHLMSLGLKTLNSGTLLTRPTFASKVVNQLYYTEVGALFGIMCRDELNRDDPTLFDTELERLLVKYGPQIWPKPSQGDRHNLRDDSDLEYPRDTAVLKQGLRKLILSKRLKPETNIEALIEKRHGDDQSTQSGARRRQHSGRTGEEADATEDTQDTDSDDSVLGATTRRRAFASRSSFTTIGLRLYRRALGGSSATIAYGPMLLPPECTTSDDCFDRIRELFSIDCSVLVFELPEDMSDEDQICVGQNSHEGEEAFQKLREIFRNAKKYPGEPRYHSVEVRVEL